MKMRTSLYCDSQVQLGEGNRQDNNARRYEKEHDLFIVKNKTHQSNVETSVSLKNKIDGNDQSHATHPYSKHFTNLRPKDIVKHKCK